MKLPSRSARCATPIVREDRRGGELLPSEESASFLLWAWPRLLGWPRRVNWVFSPVVGNKSYPGDLWGVDSRGDLLIVEAKLARAGRPQDPLADFVPYCSSPVASRLWTAASLRTRWRSLLHHEERFVRERASSLQPETALTGTYPGVLPYSRHRDATWRWQALFRQRIAPSFESGAYRRAVERSLRNRGRRNDPPPIFVGVIATVVRTEPSLSSRGNVAYHKLLLDVGRRRVCLRALRAEPHRPDSIRIRCWTFGHVPANNRLQPPALGAIVKRRS